MCGIVSASASASFLSFAFYVAFAASFECAIMSGVGTRRVMSWLFSFFSAFESVFGGPEKKKDTAKKWRLPLLEISDHKRLNIHLIPCIIARYTNILYSLYTTKLTYILILVYILTIQTVQIQPYTKSTTLYHSYTAEYNNSY